MKVVKEVCGALINKGKRFLVAQRKLDDSFGGLWEFPGGTLEEPETKEEGLKREIKEELGVEIEVGNLVYIFDDEIEDLKIHIYLFECRITKGIPRPIDCKDVKWADLRELKRLDLAPADRKVLSWLLAGQN